MPLQDDMQIVSVDDHLVEPPHARWTLPRRLVDRGGKPAGRHRGEDAEEDREHERDGEDDEAQALSRPGSAAGPVFAWWPASGS